MATTTKTEGREAVERAYNEYLRDISRFQGCNKDLKRCEDGFKKAVLSDPRITKEDIVDFINAYAFGWCADGKTALAAWARDAD